MHASILSLEQALASGARDADWLLDPASWFDLPVAARLAAAADATLRPTITRADGTVPLTELPLAELRACYETIRDWWRLLGGAERPPSLAEKAHEQLTLALRAALMAAADRDPESAVDAPRLAFPTPEHELLRDPQQALAFWRPFLTIDDSAALAAVATQLAAREDIASLGRERVWLRTLLQRQLVLHGNPQVQQALARIHADPDERIRQAEQQRRELRDAGLEWLAEQLIDELGLANPAPRSRAFRVPRTARGSAEQRDAARVTVLIPSFRHADYIAATIRSVLAQSVEQLRVLVVDDQSPDDTVAKARAVRDPRLEVRCNEQNVGLGNSVLQALETIDTPYLALLNSDDLFHPKRLEKCLAVLDEHADCDLVATGLALVDQHDKRLTPRNASALFHGRNVRDWVRWHEQAKPRSSRRDVLFGALLERNFLATSSNIVCRTEWLRAHADALRSLKYCLDWQLFLDAARERRLHWIPEQLIAYRLHPSNTVWFDSEARWAYKLEVNRVAARAIRDHVKSRPAGSAERAELALRDIWQHLRNNTEVDWTGLYLNELIGGYELEQHRRASPVIADLVAELERAAWTGSDAGAAERRRAQRLAVQFAVRTDEVYSLQSRDAWQVRRIEEDSQRLRELRGELDEARRTLEQRRAELAGLHDQRTALQQDLAKTRAESDRTSADLAAAQRQLGTTAQELARTETALANTAERLSATDAELQARRSELQRKHEELQATRAELQATRAELQATGAELQATRLWLAEVETKLAATSTRLQTAERALLATRGELNAASLALAQSRSAHAAASAEARRLQLRLDEEQRTREQRDRELGELRERHAREVRRRDAGLRRLALQVGQAAATDQRRDEQLLRLRGIRFVPGSTTLRWLRRVAKWRRKLGEFAQRLTPRLPEWRRARPVVSTTSPRAEHGELGWLCAEAGVDLRSLTMLDGNRLPFTTPPAVAPNEVARWSFPERRAVCWRWFRRHHHEQTEALLADVMKACQLSSAAATAALAPHVEYARALARTRCDLVAGGPDTDGIVRAAVAAKLLGRPWMATFGAVDEVGDLGGWVLGEVRHAGLLLARSPAIASALAAHGAARERVMTIPPPVPAPRPATEAAGDVRLLAIGCLQLDRGAETLVEVAAELRDRGLPIRLELLLQARDADSSDRALAELLRARVAEWLPGSNVTVLPRIGDEQLATLLIARPAILVAPWRARPAPAPLDRGVLAAMAAGLPIVAADTPAMRAALRPEVDGQLVSHGDGPALSAALAELVRDRALRERLGEAARRRFRGEFAPGRTRAALAERFRRLLPPS